MIKTIAKILLAIAILWTLAFVFKLGNSFALSPEFEKEIYNNCYQDAKLSLGAKRAKQYCTCTTTMLDNKYSDEDILSIGQKSEAEQIQAFAFASNHCNKNANAPKSSSDNSNSKKDPILRCKVIEGGEVVTDIVFDLKDYKQKTINDTYIEWQHLYGVEEPNMAYHQANRLTGNYILRLESLNTGKETLHSGKCEAGSTEKLF